MTGSIIKIMTQKISKIFNYIFTAVEYLSREVQVKRHSMTWKKINKQTGFEVRRFEL